MNAKERKIIEGIQKELEKMNHSDAGWVGWYKTSAWYLVERIRVMLELSESKE